MSSMVAPSQPRGVSSVGEIRLAIATLSVADQVRLKKIAQARAFGLGSIEWGDLLHEAVARMLGGTRHWPKDVPFVAFVAETMRSIASEWREQGKLLAVAGDNSEPDAGEVRFDGPDPERIAVGIDLLKRVRSAFEKDVPVLELMDGLMNGETAYETMGRTGMSQHEFDAARKRFRRGISKIIGNSGYV